MLNGKKVIDLTLELCEGKRSWNIHPKFVLMDYHTWQLNKDRFTGECKGFSTKLMTMTDHTGTHVDSQTHFFPEGDSIESYSPTKFMGDAVLLDLSDRNIKHPISKNDLEEALIQTGEKIKEDDILVVRAWPYDRNHKEFDASPGLTAKAVDWLLAKKIKLFATDLATVDLQDMSRPAHVNLLKNNILIIENLVNLSEINQTKFQFIGLPLKINNATGSPIRAIALVD